MDDLDMAAAPMGDINPRDYRYVMSLAKRYHAVVFWHRDRNGIDWQPVLMPMKPRKRLKPRR